MKTYKTYALPNGLKVIELFQKKETVAVHMLIKAGSNKEKPSNYGAAHFIEHMIFEGTPKRDSLEIASAIEGLGGEIGAYTTNERTCYYVKSLARHLEPSLEVLSDILFNPLFKKGSIEKERGVILSEVKMRNDEPRFLQWDLFLTTLFKSSPLGHPTIGTEKTIRSMTRQDLLDYYCRYYVPGNMILAITGNVKGARRLIKKYFGSVRLMSSCSSSDVSDAAITSHAIYGSKSSASRPQDLSDKGKSIKNMAMPLARDIRKKVKRDISQTYLMYGYRTVPLLHDDAVVLDVVRSILARGMSGRLFDQIRNKRGLAYDLGAHHNPGKEYGFFCLYVSTKRSDIKTCKTIMQDELKNISSISDKELEEAKNYLEGEFIMDKEDNQHLADKLTLWEYIGDVSRLDSYIHKIRSVSQKDLARIYETYFSGPYAQVMIGN